MNGFLLIDKEKGMTSFDVVAKLRRILGVKKIGHSGTLDKLATGLLLMAVGEGTKLLEFMVGLDKEYEVLAKFGAVTETFDSDSPEVQVSADVFDRDDLEKAIRENFLGKIQQIPPKYSALKIQGQRASDIARKGEALEMKSRVIRIDEFSVMNFDWPQISFNIKCGSGTYVRSLVHDLGQKLGCGGYVLELRRTKVGDFDVEDSKILSEFSESDMIPMEKIAEMFVTCELSDDDFNGLKDGRILENKKIEHNVPVMAFHKGKLVGVLEDFGAGVKYRKMIL
ncbi:MAG: tRNA pseudouridine(55) synthase TruB [bacterium]|nr:tRNA pseudouridine(55) synthase TruB [bacterium]